MGWIPISIQRISPESYFNRDSGVTIPQVASASMSGIPSIPQAVYIQQPAASTAVPDNIILLGIVGIVSMVTVVALAFAFMATRKGE